MPIPVLWDASWAGAVCTLCLSLSFLQFVGPCAPPLPPLLLLPPPGRFFGNKSARPFKGAHVTQAGSEGQVNSVGREHMWQGLLSTLPPRACGGQRRGQTDKQADRPEAGRHAGTAGRQTGRQAGKQTIRQAPRPCCRAAHRGAPTHPPTHTQQCCCCCCESNA